MTKDDVREIMQPLLEDAFRDGKQGKPHRHATLEEFVSFYREENGKEPTESLQKFFTFAEKAIQGAHARGMAAAQAVSV